MTVRVVPKIRGVHGTMVGQLKRAAKGAGNTLDGSDSQPDVTRKGAVAIMLAQPSDNQTEARPVLFGAPANLPAPAGRHYYVDDPTATGYCAACSLPASNRRRHVARRAA